jgi:NAD(P)-dependent dehydrogenase (short-subunit alcohol dehydrogenase family)
MGNAMKLRGKVAIVTGAGRNIGEETAKLFAREGAKVAVVDLDSGRAENVASEIKAAGGDARPFVADISEEPQIEALIEAVTAAFARIDILINNVAISDNKHMLDITREEWDRVIAVTLTAPFLMAKHVAKAMIEQKSGGAIVNIGSTSGYFGRPRAIAYTAAKGGIANLTRSMAIQLAPHDIRVMSLVPNKIGSPVGKDTFNPNRPVVNLRKNRPGVPEDVARALLFLVSEDADFITGSELFVDGGVTAIMPGSD